MEKDYVYELIEESENKFPIKVTKYSMDDSFRPHWHEHSELLYIFEGSGTATCNESTFDVKKGDLIVVNSTQIHTLSAASHLEFLCVLIYPSFFSDVEFDSENLIKNLISDDEFIAKSIYDIFSVSKKAIKASTMQIKGLCYLLMSYLVQNYSQGRMDAKAVSLHTIKLERAQVVFNYINQNCEKKLTTSELASICHINESYFCRFFKKTFGRTPIEYINECRVARAVILLEKTSENISEIALKSGFDDINYFSRVFKRIKKISPSQYREKIVYKKT